MQVLTGIANKQKPTYQFSHVKHYKFLFWGSKTKQNETESVLDSAWTRQIFVVVATCRIVASSEAHGECRDMKYVYMYICIHVCMYICIYMYTLHICICINIYMYIYMYIYVYIYVYICI